MALNDGETLWHSFRDATLWAKDEPFYTVNGSGLHMRWMSLAAEIIGLQAALVGDRGQFDIYVELASKFDIEVVRPYLVAGVVDVAIIEHCVAHDIDADMAKSMHTI